MVSCYPVDQVYDYQVKSDLVNTKASKLVFLSVINFITRTKGKYREERRLKFCGTVHYQDAWPPIFRIVSRIKRLACGLYTDTHCHTYLNTKDLFVLKKPLIGGCGYISFPVLTWLVSIVLHFFFKHLFNLYYQLCCFSFIS